MKNWKKVIGVASAAAMTAAMMMPTSVFAADDETFKIGVIGPMTGDYAQYGTNVYNAAKIAADEINENGGFNGYKVEILDAGDDQGDLCFATKIQEQTSSVCASQTRHREPNLLSTFPSTNLQRK